MNDFERRQRVVDLHLRERYNTPSLVLTRGDDIGIECSACGLREVRSGRLFRIYRSYDSLEWSEKNVDGGARIIEPPLAFEAIVAVCEACQIFAPALSSLAAHGGLLAETVAKEFAASIAMSVRLSCPHTRTSDPSISITLTNGGDERIPVPQLPVSLLVHLEIIGKHGILRSAATPDSDTQTSIRSRWLPPGKSMLLDDWRPGHYGEPPLLPLSLFGYRLQPGVYSIRASISGRPGAPASNVCSIEVA